MRGKNFILILVLLIGTIVVQQCKEKECDCPAPVQSPPTLLINFNHQFQGQELLLNKIYINENQDSISFSEHKYIISNVVLINTLENKSMAVPDSYYLVKVPLESGNFSIEIKSNLLVGDWDQIEFLIGLDSAINFAPEGGPKLFSDEGMFWEWNTGYKFFVAEGKYYSQSLPFPSVGYIAHIGDMNNLIKLNIDLSSFGGLALQKDETSLVFLDVNVDELFYNPNLINLGNSLYRNVTGGGPALEYRENYSSNYWELNNIIKP